LGSFLLQYQKSIDSDRALLHIPPNSRSHFKDYQNQQRAGSMSDNLAAKPHVHRISISEKTGERKENVATVSITREAGIEGDAHGRTRRQISLLALESFHKVEHPDLEIKPGDFAENITTLGLDYMEIGIGSRLRLGKTAEVEVIQIGKECHNDCVIKETVGDCIMPREGFFVRVLKDGILNQGDIIEVLNSHD
jgi:MOSC domain-containing protein YiiM